MKHTLCLLLAILVGCATLTPERINLLIALAAQAAEIAAKIWLRDHPTQRPAFEVSINAFSDAVRKGDTNAVEFLGSLPTSTFIGPDRSALYVTGNRLVVWDESASKAYVVTNLAPIAAGFRRGLATAPPRLPARQPIDNNRVLQRFWPKEGETWPTTNATDAELDAQFEAVKAKLAPRADYAIEHNAGGTNWIAVGVITNAPAGEWRVRRVR